MRGFLHQKQQIYRVTGNERPHKKLADAKLLYTSTQTPY